ncbi:hypothetical protein DYBT9275_02404 [Dyadobacter sp. CECT 9275]|uniref:Double-GTPase 2 domain-containing protein n=1 Tax=Dyadobacter helix TaxID=2822344 RepID=A0A916NLD5_9BACT|nr:hypothetical protein [Dyadobacter sp. CECT 9275]CAG5000156.1 hypothetical protein DYBT9275_02404 [Dyadobacter sp. CECT 9275]
MTTPINISVLGKSGVGKTSALIAMFNHFQSDFFEGFNLRFAFDPTTGKLISEERNRLISSLEKGTLDHTYGIRPTQDIVRYKVQLGRKGENFTPLHIEFIDYPGSWLTGTAAEQSNVKDIISSSKVLIIPIDSALLMETDNDLSANEILAALKDIYSEQAGPRMIVLAPVKSEKYYEPDNSSHQGKAYYSLIKRVQEKYEGIISFLTSKHLNRTTSLVITPIQTLGSCKLLYFSSSEDAPQTPVFVVTQRGVYAPKHAEQPLLSILSFLFKDQYEEQNKGFKGILRRFKGDSKYLKTTSEELSQFGSSYDEMKFSPYSYISHF